MINDSHDIDYQHLKDETVRMINEIQTALPLDGGGEPNTLSNAEASLIGLWKNILLEDNKPVESDIEIGGQIYPNSAQTVTCLIAYYLLENNCADVVEKLICEMKDGKEEVIKIRDDHARFKEIVFEISEDSTRLLENFLESYPSKMLELYLVSHEFLLLIHNGRYDEALKLCLKKLKSFVPTYIRDVKPLLKFLVNPVNVEEALEKNRERLIENFKSEYLEVTGIPNRCYLEELFETGTSAFLQLSSSGNLFFDKDDQTLPVEIKLEKGRNYHSLFICPVLKTLCVGENIPVMLECGHVISLEAANVLSQEGVLNSFKCPYCPEMSRYENILRLRI
ncbi:RING zinc finger-containing protein [Encephalitozoon romaleae SJ-2008]|uniref:RING zinc finger-containing protein n=1 Tax=Encephalitozoon romaleae (strain SJ-2008) TaxID=1178016 RepID=I7AE54_ENCRO|nr:RING zinc finger-containing protein [Encephalitozoon romaleae SJ-2008]AFN82910.1 RING zinc finger-containing protein [Encephalitozoon romaleae SJ-2008]